MALISRFCGTVRINRKHFPTALKHLSLKRPQYKFATYKSFTAGIWHDRRDVTFLTTVGLPRQPNWVATLSQKD